jgi:hypothetical protein
MPVLNTEDEYLKFCAALLVTRLTMIRIGTSVSDTDLPWLGR